MIGAAVSSVSCAASHTTHGQLVLFTPRAQEAFLRRQCWRGATPAASQRRGQTPTEYKPRTRRHSRREQRRREGSSSWLETWIQNMFGCIFLFDKENIGKCNFLSYHLVNLLRLLFERYHMLHRHYAKLS